MEYRESVRKWFTGTQVRNFSVVVLGILLAILALAQAPADQIWNELVSGNRRFMNGKSEPRDLVARRRELAKTQNPRVAVLSCSDSRVPPELVLDQGLGDLFVVRSAGGSADPLALGSLRVCNRTSWHRCYRRDGTPKLRCGEGGLFRRKSCLAEPRSRRESDC